MEVNLFKLGLDFIFTKHGEERLQCILSFLKFIDDRNLTIMFIDDISPEYVSRFNDMFYEFREGFSDSEGYFSPIRKLAIYAPPDMLKEFYDRLSKETLIEVLMFYLSSDLYINVKYLIDNYLKPSEIPKVRWPNGNIDYPEHLSRLPKTAFLFYDPNFITQDRKLKYSAYSELIRSLDQKMNGRLEYDYEGFVNDVPELKILDNPSFFEFDNRHFRETVYAIDFVNGEYTTHIRRNERYLKCFEFLDYYIDVINEDSELGTYYSHFEKFLKHNRILDMDKKVSESRFTLGYTELLDRINKINIPGLTRLFHLINDSQFYDDVLFYEFLNDTTNYSDVVDDVLIFYYKLVHEYAKSYLNQEEQNRVKSILSDTNPLPLMILGSFINEDIRLEKKRENMSGKKYFTEVIKDLSAGLREYVERLISPDTMSDHFSDPLSFLTKDEGEELITLLDEYLEERDSEYIDRLYEMINSITDIHPELQEKFNDAYSILESRYTLEMYEELTQRILEQYE